jgi:ribosome-associated heat shock protein Hsp15
MRIDRYLSVARIFKSRSLAAEAISSSMVYIDGAPAKASREVQPGSVVEIDTPRFYRKIEVLLLPGGNVTKVEASGLYRLLEERSRD